MDIKPVSSRAKAVALCILVACSGLGGTALGASSTSSASHPKPESVGFQASNGAPTAYTDSSSAGFELDYFHAYKGSKTYAIQLKNGLKASFDFENGTATIDDGTTQVTLPLEQVLLGANHGNVQAAAEMYDEMYDSIIAAHSDGIMQHMGAGGYSTRGIFDPPRWNDGIGLNDPLWGVPGQGDCWPIPFPCHQWSGGLSDWGAYNQWWNSPFGSPPPTPNPPNPDGCAPNDTNCIRREINRQNACDSLSGDEFTSDLAFTNAALICRVGAGAGWPGWAACGVSMLGYAKAEWDYHKDTKQCRSP